MASLGNSIAGLAIAFIIHSLDLLIQSLDPSLIVQLIVCYSLT